MLVYMTLRNSGPELDFEPDDETSWKTKTRRTISENTTMGAEAPCGNRNGFLSGQRHFVHNLVLINDE